MSVITMYDTRAAAARRANKLDKKFPSAVFGTSEIADPAGRGAQFFVRCTLTDGTMEGMEFMPDLGDVEVFDTAGVLISDQAEFRPSDKPKRARAAKAPVEKVVKPAKPAKSAKAAKPAKSAKAAKPAKVAKPAKAAKTAKPAKAAKPLKPAKAAKTAKPNDEDNPFKPHTKKNKIYRMLHRRSGTTLPDLAREIGWAERSAYTAIYNIAREAGATLRRNNSRYHID